MRKLIIEFEPNKVFPSVPPKYKIYYKYENEFEFKEVILTHDKIKEFFESLSANSDYSVEVNNSEQLKKFGIELQQLKNSN